MKRTLLLTILLTFQLIASDDRWINIDWEEVSGTSGYELELLEKVDNELLSHGLFKVQTPKWTKSVAPGIYSLKIRSLDKRGVAGPWSPPIPLAIKLPSVSLVSPSPDEEREVPDNSKGLEMTFVWDSVSGAKFYKLNIYDEKKNRYYSTLTNSTEQKILLTDKKRYFWEVLPQYTKDEQPLEKTNLRSFSISGGELRSPELKAQVLNRDVHITWPPIVHAESYHYEIFKISDDGEMKSIVKNTTTQTRLIFTKDKYDIGTYSVNIKAVAEAYRASLLSEIIYKYDREVINIIKHEIQTTAPTDSIDRFKRYISTSIGMLSVNYDYTNFEKDTASNQKLTGLQLNSSYYEQLESLKIKNKIPTSKLEFAAYKVSDSTASTVWLHLAENVSTSFDFRLRNQNLSLTPAIGLFIERTPLIATNRLVKNNSQIEYFLSSGIKIGNEFLYKINPWWRLSLDPEFTFDLLYPSAPKGRTFSPALGYKCNLKLNYFFKANIDIYLLGSTFKKSYNLTPSLSDGSLAKSGDNNQLIYSSTNYSAGLTFYF